MKCEITIRIGDKANYAFRANQSHVSSFLRSIGNLFWQSNYNINRGDCLSVGPTTLRLLCGWSDTICRPPWRKINDSNHSFIHSTKHHNASLVRVFSMPAPESIERVSPKCDTSAATAERTATRTTTIAHCFMVHLVCSLEAKTTEETLENGNTWDPLFEWDYSPTWIPLGFYRSFPHLVVVSGLTHGIHVCFDLWRGEKWTHSLEAFGEDRQRRGWRRRGRGRPLTWMLKIAVIKVRWRWATWSQVDW